MTEKIPLKISQKISYITNRMSEYDFTKKQLDKFNSVLNNVTYEIDYAIVVENARRKK